MPQDQVRSAAVYCREKNSVGEMFENSYGRRILSFLQFLYYNELREDVIRRNQRRAAQSREKREEGIAG